MAKAVIVLILMTIVMFGAFAMLPGCAQAPAYTEADLRPLIAADGTARSLATDSPEVVALRPDRAADAPLPWYHDRNDHRATLYAGYQSPAVLGAYTRTTDFQHATSNGNVHDHYSRRTYRYESVDGVR